MSDLRRAFWPFVVSALAALTLVASARPDDTADRVRVALALAQAQADATAAPKTPTAGRPGPARTQAQPALTIQWTGTDPAGWHRHRNPRTGKIVAHRTHLDRWGRMVGSDAEHTIDGDLCRGLYTGPLPPTEVPLDYPLIVRPANQLGAFPSPACPPGQP